MYGLTDKSERFSWVFGNNLKSTEHISIKIYTEKGSHYLHVQIEILTKLDCEIPTFGAKYTVVTPWLFNLLKTNRNDESSLPPGTINGRNFTKFVTHDPQTSMLKQEMDSSSYHFSASYYTHGPLPFFHIYTCTFLYVISRNAGARWVIWLTSDASYCSLHGLPSLLFIYR